MLKGTGHAAGCLWCVIFCVILTCSSCSQFGTFWHYSAWIQVKPSSCRVFEVVLSCLLNRWILRKQAPHDLPHSRTLFYGKCSIYIWHPMAIYGREPSFCMLLLLPKAVNWFSWCSDCWCYLHLQRWWYVMTSPNAPMPQPSRSFCDQLMGKSSCTEVARKFLRTWHGKMW